MKHVKHGGGLHLYPVNQPLQALPRLKAPTGWDCPPGLNNNGYCTPLENQGRNPWCAAYSMNQMLQASYWREFHRKVDFSEERTYTGAKSVDGIKGDGTTLMAVMSAVRGEDFGVGAVPQFDAEGVYDSADVLFAVHKYGLVLIGMQISNGWQTLTADGMIGPAGGTMGGHAVLVSGYDLTAKLIWGPNWWGRTWGRDGFWTMTLSQFDEQFAYGYAMRINWEKVNG